MVRKIVACSNCNRRFISKSGVVRCDACIQILEPNEKIDPDDRRTSSSNNNDDLSRQPKRFKSMSGSIFPTPSSVPPSSDPRNESERKYGSCFNPIFPDQANTERDNEGSDTNLVDPAAFGFLTHSICKRSGGEGSDNSEEEDADEELTLAEIAALNQSASLKETSPVDNINAASSSMIDEEHAVKKTLNPAEVSLPGDVCLICGCTFDKMNGLKARINHMKRCSKKHGFSGRDTVVDDYDDFVETSNTSHGGVLVRNPYANEGAMWHGDASIDLKLAANAYDVEGSKSETVAVQTIQTKIKNFFDAPVRSLNNVLLLGARKVAKTGGIMASKKPPRNRGGWGGRTKARNFTNSPEYKRITGTDFNVDGFMYARSTITKNYWLTHFHCDHYGGITKDWNHGTIYCSLPTANLVNQQLGVDKKWLHPMPMNTPQVVESHGKPVTVTLLDANHCPGAVMFLFEIGKRRILHVGDFRWNSEVMLKQGPLKHLNTNSIPLDELYLDTTYCDERYDLPSQKDAIHACVDVAMQEISRPGKTLFLFGSYTIGKERIYLSVAEKLGMRVFVDNNKMKVLQALDWPKDRLRLLTTNREDTSLWVVPLGHINFKNMGRYVGGSSKVFSSRSFDRVVGFRPTGWTHSARGGLVSSSTSGPFTVHGVPYSEHSSFPELIECLRILRPKRIVPTVSVSKSQDQIDLLLSALRKRGECHTTTV